ncbi:tetratricopeptide repeat protein [Croceitalea sp. P059]|uniref:tetratricopeptide repeat protein n=1 Tax=Croceitalea sp. P059 TaxID=3075601 RepID=UPI002884B3F8|nr:tetratricopeptide repeat protein [Croceitalea sp. P059]MDT0539105.1 tetratricopeptide repeat protein [Croceitalea sp. P059]
MKHYLACFFLLFILKAEAQTPPANNVGSASAADSLYLIGNYTKAINAYAALGDENSSLQIARSYAAMGNTQKAIMQYEGLLQKYPTNTLAKFELGKLFDKTKNYTAAQSVFVALTQSNSDNPEFYYYLGKSLQSTSDYKTGNKALKKAVQLDSTHLRSIYLLGKYYVGVEEPANATRIIELGLKTAPNDVALINLKALTKFDIGEYESAASLFERLVELGEKKPFVYKKLGYAQSNIRAYEKAKSTYRKLEEIPNYEPEAYMGLGQVFLMEQQLDSAETYVLKSIEAKQYVFDNEYQSLGRIAHLKGELKKSLEYYTKAWEENKSNMLHYWQVSIIADEYYKDPNVKIGYYENLISQYKNLPPFLKERAEKRIRELKEEIHFAKD